MFIADFTRIIRYLVVIFAIFVLSSGAASAQNSDFITSISDFDADGFGDLVLHDPGSSTFAIRNSSTGEQRVFSLGSIGDAPALGDFNGDGKADVAAFNRSTGTWSVSITDSVNRTHVFGNVGDIPVPGFYTGQSCTELATYNRTTALWTIGDCEGGRASSFSLGNPGSIPVPADFDCDGITDPAVFDPSLRKWTVRQSSNEAEVSFNFGLWWDLPVPADYNGDGCAQPAVYRQDGGDFFIAEGYTADEEATLTRIVQWGLHGDRPALYNVDGDRAVDFAVLRPSTNTFFVKSSSADNLVWAIPFSSPSDYPNPVWIHNAVTRKVPGDFNRDGRSDLVFASADRSAFTTTFSVLHSNSSTSSYTIAAPGDAIVTGDYNGDGRTQAAVVYVRTWDAMLDWHIQTPAGGETAEIFGVNGDSPVRGDFDCDGKTDKAVVRAVNGALHWFMDLSSQPAVVDIASYPFGLQGDSVYAADVYGDGCDELVISRNFMGGILWAYRSLSEGIDRVIFPHGLEGDTTLQPSDLDGDGKADFIVARGNGAGGVDIFFLGSVTNSLQAFSYGLVGDVPVTGFFSGVNRSEFGVYRRDNTSFFIKRFFGLTSVIPYGNSQLTLVSPTGGVFPAGEGEIGGGGSGPITGCTGPTDFFDGAGDALWKPYSDNTGNPVMLLEGYYWTKITKIEVLGNDGNVVVEGRRRTCCPNGGRAHYDIPMSANRLDDVAPITVMIYMNDGTKECRVVEEPTRRND